MSARDAAIDELCKLLPDAARADVAMAVARIITASAEESGARVAESLVEPLAVAVRRHADGVSALLGRAHRSLLGAEVQPPQE